MMSWLNKSEMIFCMVFCCTAKLRQLHATSVNGLGATNFENNIASFGNILGKNRKDDSVGKITNCCCAIRKMKIVPTDPIFEQKQLLSLTQQLFATSRLRLCYRWLTILRHFLRPWTFQTLRPTPATPLLFFHVHHHPPAQRASLKLGWSNSWSSRRVYF